MAEDNTYGKYWWYPMGPDETKVEEFLAIIRSINADDMAVPVTMLRSIVVRWSDPEDLRPATRKCVRPLEEIEEIQSDDK